MKRIALTASVIALSNLANAGIIVTRGHIVGGSATGTLVAIDSPYISNANGTTATFGGPSWTTGGTIVAHQADQGFAAPSSPSNDGIREFDLNGTPWEPDGTPFSQARGYFIYPDGPAPGTTWTFNLAASGIDLPDGTIIHGVYARFGGRNSDKARYEFTEGATSGNLLVDQNSISSVGDLALRWFDADGNPRDSNFQRIFSSPVTVTGGDGFQLKITDTSAGNAGHIDAIILDTSLPKANDVPAISTLLPVDNEPSYVIWKPLEVTFDEPIALTGTGNVTITDLTDGSSTQVINLPDPRVTSPNGDDILITPSSRLELGTNYSVRISANAVRDLAAVPNSFPGILDDTTWSFNTRPMPDVLHNVLIVTAALADAQPSATAAQATDLIFHDPRNVDEAMRVASYQRIGLNLGDSSGLPTTVSLSFPETVAQQQAAGGSTNLRSRMATSLTALGYNLSMSNFRFILYIQPAALNTGNDGWANLFSNTSVYLAAPFNLRLAMHEMGHCLGGNHSNGSDFGCSLGGADVDYNASKKILFGWLNTPAGNVLNLAANTGTTQTLVPLSRDPDAMPGMRAIRVPNPNGGTATFVVSYRINDGLYNTLQNSSFSHKIFVAEDTGGSATTHRAALAAGQSYTNGKLIVTCNSVAGDGLSANVTIGVGNPTLVSIADDVSGGPVTVGQSVNYTVTFDEAINAATIGTNDFENGSTAGININSVSATGNPAVFTVAVTTTAPGNLNLRIKAGAVIEDLSASALNTVSPLPDNTTIAVNLSSAPTLVSIVDDVSGGLISVGAVVNYTVNFSEAINATTVGTDDFENGGSAGITVDSVSATGNPAVFSVTVTTVSAGPLKLQIKAGAVIEDLAATSINSASALPDNTTISVKSTSAPVLLSIVDNASGGPITEGASVSYSVTFDEAINAATLGTDDFENGSTGGVIVNSVSATANPAVFTVNVTTTFRGDLTLQIKAGAVIEDLVSFALDTSSALPDDNTIIINFSSPPTLLSINDNVSGGPVTAGTPVSYAVTFDKAIDAPTLTTADFENGSSAGITVDSASATANPAVFTVVVTTTTSGSLNLRIKAGAVIEDNFGLLLVTTSALPDNTTITVNSLPAVLYWDDNSNGTDFGTAGANTGTWAAPTAGPTAGWSLSNTGANIFAALNTGTADTLNFGNGATGLGAGTINVVGMVDAGNMTFASGSGTIVLTGGIINLVAAATITVNNATNTIGSVLTGAATSLTKAGTGTLVLSGSSSYSGTTSVSAGTLALSAANTISGATSVAATGTLQLGHATSMGSSTITLANNATLQLRNDADTTFTAPIATPAGAVTYNFDVNNAASAVTGKTLSRGNITFATNTANQINVTGGNSYTLGLGTLSSPSGTGGPYAFTVNATTAAVTIAKFSAGSFGNSLTLQGGNAINLSNFEMGSNSTNSVTVSGSGTVATLGTTTQTNTRAGGNVSYTLSSGTLNLTTTTSLANIRAASGTLNAPTLTINGGTLNNTSGSALTLAASPASGTVAGSPAITLGGNFTFGASTSANNLNLGTGAITNAGNRTITFAGTGTTLTLGGIMSNTSGANQTTTVNGADNTLSLGGYSLSNSVTNRVNVINGSGNVNITGAVSNGGSTASGLTYSGSGTLTLSAVNTFAGATTINSGTLAIAPTGQLTSSTAATAVTTVNTGGTLQVYAWQYGLSGSIGSPFFGTSTLIVNGGTITYTGVGENSGNNNGRVFAIGIKGATLNAAGSGTWFITRNAGAPLDQTTINGLTLTGSGNGRHGNILAGTGGTLTKSGNGTWTLAGANTYTGTTTINQGTLTLGVDNALSNSSNVLIGTGALSADANVDDTAGTLDVTAAATINLGSGATLAFADSKLVDWTGGTLNINGTLGTTSLRFGTDNTGLSLAQLAVISVNNSGLGTYTLDGLGYLVVGGGGPGPLDHFAISAISSPQTVGTPITGIMLTAQDAANQTISSFTGTVTFGGTGGFAGTSATFTAGVLSGVSVTPTNAGSGLTFTVTNIGTGKTGTTTITTIQTQYEAWALGALFDTDANKDGVDNGLAFLLGASGPNVSAIGLLPTVTQSGGDLVLEFECLAAAERGAATLNLQHSSDLGVTDAWATALVPGAIGNSTVGNVDFVVTDPGAPGGALRVVATVQANQASQGKLFGRLIGTE